MVHWAKSKTIHEKKIFVLFSHITMSRILSVSIVHERSRLACFVPLSHSLYSIFKLTYEDNLHNNNKNTTIICEKRKISHALCSYWYCFLFSFCSFSLQSQRKYKKFILDRKINLHFYVISSLCDMNDNNNNNRLMHPVYWQQYQNEYFSALNWRSI